jgi:hypothetical protein
LASVVEDPIKVEKSAKKYRFAVRERGGFPLKFANFCIGNTKPNTGLAISILGGWIRSLDLRISDRVPYRCAATTSHQLFVDYSKEVYLNKLECLPLSVTSTLG